MVLDLQLDQLYLLEKALYGLQDGITILDKDATIIYINKEGQDIFERNQRPIPSVGNYYFDFITSNNLTIIKCIIGQGFEGATTTTKLSVPQELETLWYELTVSPIVEDTSIINHVCLKVRNITDKIVLEQQLETLHHTERRKIVKASIDAQEKERAEIGKELHDNVNQTLTTVKLYNEIVLEEELPNNNLLLRSIDILNHTINEVRQLSRQLASPSSTTLSLKDLIGDLVDSINIMHRVLIEFEHEGIEDLNLPNDYKIGIFRIIQEQINNTLKHAKASLITIRVNNNKGHLTVDIIDNGVGFIINSNKKGIGMINMTSRTEALGGTINLQSQLGKGCQLSLVFTLENCLK